MKEVISHLADAAKREGITRLVVGAIISRNQKVLCLKRAGTDFMPGLYELPSGKVDANEDIDIALAREVKEETNLTVSSIKKYIGHFDYQSRSGANTRQLNFVVDVNSDGHVMLHEKEHEGYTWLTPNELGNYKISPEVQQLIRQHFESHNIHSERAPSPTMFGQKRGREDEGEDNGEDKSSTSLKVPALGNTGVAQ
jgi:8-oxo-dGTP diphosphatase